MPEEMLTLGIPNSATVILEDGVMVAAEDSVMVPEEIGIVTVAETLPICTT